MLPIIFLAGCFISFGLVAQDQTDPLPPVPDQKIDAGPYVAAFQKVDAFLKRSTSLKADFVQRNPDGSVMRGQLYMQRPGKIRFDYGDQVPFLVVSDGNALHMIDYEIGQVTRWPVADTPLALFLGKNIDLAALKANIQPQPQGIEGVIAVSVIDDERPEIGQITVYFRETGLDDQPLQIVSWVVVDAKGALTIVELSNHQNNSELADSLWDFDDPRGMTRRRRVR